MKRFLTLGFFLLTIIGAAQLPEGEMFNFFGKVTKMNIKDSIEKPLDGVLVEFWAKGVMIGSTTTAQKGKYSLNLPFQQTYTMKYKYNGYVTKLIEVNVERFYDEAEKNMLKMQIDVALFKDDGYMGLDFLSSLPVAKASYVPRKKTLVWDDKYHQTMRKRVISVLNKYEASAKK